MNEFVVVTYENIGGGRVIYENVDSDHWGTQYRISDNLICIGNLAQFAGSFTEESTFLWELISAYN